jgi:ribosomal protein S18 acetylase RimI-like enzyme
MNTFARVLPIIDSHADIFDFLTKRRIARLAAKALDENPRKPLLFSAIHEGAAIGFIGFHVSTDNPTESELFGHVVKRGYEGQGIGTKLLLHGLERLEDSGVGTVALLLKASAPTYVTRYYRKIGFRPHFDEEYTGASDEARKFVLLLSSEVESVPANFYPA